VLSQVPEEVRRSRKGQVDDAVGELVEPVAGNRHVQFAGYAQLVEGVGDRLSVARTRRSTTAGVSSPIWELARFDQRAKRRRRQWGRKTPVSNHRL
jgi:hypothetical protein